MATGVPKIEWNNDPSVVLPPRHGEVIDITRAQRRRAQEDFVRLWPSSSADRKNRLYWSDNIDALGALRCDRAVAGKVRLVYIDPPYATNSVFQSKSMKPAYADVLTGERYLSFLRERVAALRDLMADDGSMYVHLDATMVFHAKVLLDEIFGVRNFRNFITRRKCSSKNFTHKAFGDIADYILFYTKGDTWVWNKPVEPWTDEHALKEYPYVEEGTGRRFKKVPAHAPGVRNGPCGQRWRGMSPPAGRHWKSAPDKLDELDAKGEIYWSANGNPRKKVYLDASRGVPVSNIWLDCRDAHNQNVKITGYPTEKGQKVLDRIIQASSEPDDLVLDAFCGSGTTLAAASAAGRRWIGIDNSMDAIATSAMRFRGTNASFALMARRAVARDPATRRLLAQIK